MLAMRLKLGSGRNKEWTCCFCLHVRTATILFGIWHLVLHVLALTVLAMMMRNHHLAREKDEFQNDFLPTPLSKRGDEDNPYYLPSGQDGRKIYSADIDMGALMTVCTLSITMLMVYGTVKGKPTHILPFFCLQLFDFAITALTATGYFCYLRSAHRLIAENWNLAFRRELLQLSPQVLTLIVLLAFLFSMLWKAYWISVIWRCYKYLTVRRQSDRNAIHYIVPELDRSGNVVDVDYPSLFGGQTFFKQTPPPSYRDAVAMEERPPPYVCGVTEVIAETASARHSTIVVQPEVQSESHTPEILTSAESDVELAVPLAGSAITTEEVAENKEVVTEAGAAAIVEVEPKTDAKVSEVV